jgi:hypothetical protein
MRVVLASLCFVAIAGAAFAQQQQQPPPGVLDQVYACASISDEAQRLACYDGAVGRLRQAQDSGNLVAVDRQQAEELDRDAFGFSLPSLSRLFGGGSDAATPPSPGQQPRFERVDEMQLEIARVSMRRDGTVSITMTNGQVWSQIDNENPRMVRVGGTVTVRRATMGSYLMSIEAGGPALRVRRTQ